MTRNQRIRLNMYLSVRNLRNRFAEAIKKISKYESSSAILQGCVDQIQQVSEEQGMNKTGLAVDKNRLRKNLTAITLKNSGKLSIFARSNKNDILLKEVRLNESDLARLAGVTLRDKARVIYDKVQANIGSLQEQGITEETQKSFLEIINSFNNALSAPRTGIAERSQATQKLEMLFQSAEEAIEIMDLAAGSAKDEQPDFYNAYRTARKLVDINSGKMALRARAVDIKSGEPLKGVLFSFRHNGTKPGGNGNSNGEIVKRTSEKGGFNIKNMESGIYHVAIKKAGYKDKEAEVNVSEKERSELIVELERV